MWCDVIFRVGGFFVVGGLSIVIVMFACVQPFLLLLFSCCSFYYISYFGSPVLLVGRSLLGKKIPIVVGSGYQKGTSQKQSRGWISHRKCVGESHFVRNNFMKPLSSFNKRLEQNRRHITIFNIKIISRRDSRKNYLFGLLHET